MTKAVFWTKAQSLVLLPQYEKGSLDGLLGVRVLYQVSSQHIKDYSKYTPQRAEDDLNQG